MQSSSLRIPPFILTQSRVRNWLEEGFSHLVKTNMEANGLGDWGKRNHLHHDRKPNRDSLCRAVRFFGIFNARLRHRHFYFQQRTVAVRAEDGGDVVIIHACLLRYIDCILPTAFKGTLIVRTEKFHLHRPFGYRISFLSYHSPYTR